MNLQIKMSMNLQMPSYFWLICINNLRNSAIQST